MAQIIGLTVAAIVLSGFLCIVIGLGIPVDDTPDDLGDKAADLAEMPAPRPVDFPPFHDAETIR